MTSLDARQLQAIDRAKEGLVVAAEAWLDNSPILEIKAKDLGHSQLRNLIAIAADTESPAVVRNFVRYQMGRDKSRGNWRRPDANGLSLGERLIEEIDSGAIAEGVESVPGAEPGTESEQLVRIHLLRHYLGFAARYLKYLDLSPGRRGGDS